MQSRADSPLAFLIPLLLLIPAPSHAQEPADSLPGAAVTGVVGDATTGSPIPGAIVRVPDADLVAVTNGAGRFVLFGVPAGEHGWRIEALGYAGWEQSLAVSDLESLSIGLLPRPVALDNIRVTVERLATRRKLSPISVVAVTREKLLSTIAVTAAEAITSLSPFRVVSCPGVATEQDLGALKPGQAMKPMYAKPGAPGEGRGLCLWARGQLVHPTLMLDERKIPLEVLLAYQTAELFAVEYYGGGREIRVYTVEFVEKGRPLRPLGF